MRGRKAFGDRIAAKETERQPAEIRIRVALINRFNALGTAKTVRVAWYQWRKGPSRLELALCNIAEP